MVVAWLAAKRTTLSRHVESFANGRTAGVAAGIYLLVLAGVYLFVVISVTVDPDGNLAGVWLLLLTLPLSWLTAAIPVGHLPDAAPGWLSHLVGVLYITLDLLAGVAQAWIFWRLARGPRVDPETQPP